MNRTHTEAKIPRRVPHEDANKNANENSPKATKPPTDDSALTSLRSPGILDLGRLNWQMP